MTCRLDLQQQQHPGVPPARQHDGGDASSDSSSSSNCSDSSDCEEESCSDMIGIKSSAVSISCENVRLQTHSGGTASTVTQPHRSAVLVLPVLL